MPTRKELEDEIVRAGYYLLRKTGPSGSAWVNSQEFRNFLEAWRNLRLFYAENDDVDIGVEPLNEYVNFMGILRDIRLDNTKPLDEDVEDAIHALEESMIKVLEYALQNVYRTGRNIRDSLRKPDEER